MVEQGIERKNHDRKQLEVTESLKPDSDEIDRRKHGLMGNDRVRRFERFERRCYKRAEEVSEIEELVFFRESL